MRPIIFKGIRDFLISRKEMVENTIVEDRRSVNGQDTYQTIGDLFERRVEDARRLCAGDRPARRS
jgi:hypothetical protein